MYPQSSRKNRDQILRTELKRGGEGARLSGAELMNMPVRNNSVE